MLIAILISAVLMSVNTAVHYVALRRIADAVEPALHPGRCLALGVAALTVAHLVEALVYASGFWVAVHSFELGDLRATGRDRGADLTFMDYFYFSMVNYTTLGRGDLIPSGHLRFMAALEAFYGFLLITASGSFLLQIMSGRNPFGSRD